MNPLELLATLFGVVNIVLLVRRSIWNFPFGLVMVALYARIFSASRLYSEALLQLFFFAIQSYGWWQWARAGADDDGVPVRLLSPTRRAGWIGTAAIACLGWGWLMSSRTGAVHPWWDGSIAVLSIIAQLLLAWRYVENWALWIAVDMLAIALYWQTGLHLSAGLYALFLLLAIWGLIEWAGKARGAEHAP